MELKEAIQVLKDHNNWRRYDGEISESPKMTDPKKLGVAIDTVVNEFENLFISGVVKSFYCDNMEEEGMLSCGDQCDFCKKYH